MARSNNADGIYYGPKFIGAKYGQAKSTLSGTFQVPADGPTFYYLDPGGVVRIVKLPAIAQDGGQMYFVANVDTLAELTIQDVSGNYISTVAPGTTGLFISSSTAWSPLSSGSVSSVRHQRSVTSSPIVISASDEVINSNITSGSPTCTLPLANTRGGRPITIKDVGAQFSAHPLTISRTGSDTIDGATSFVMDLNRQSATFTPFSDGVNTGWFVS